MDSAPFLVTYGAYVPPIVAALVMLATFACVRYLRRRSLVRSAAIGAAATSGTLVAMVIVGQLALALQLEPQDDAAHQHNGLSDDERLPGIDPSALTNFDAFSIGAAMPGSRDTSVARLDMAVDRGIARCVDEQSTSDERAMIHNRCGIAMACRVAWRVSCLGDPREVSAGELVLPPHASQSLTASTAIRTSCPRTDAQLLHGGTPSLRIELDCARATR